MPVTSYPKTPEHIAHKAIGDWENPPDTPLTMDDVFELLRETAYKGPLGAQLKDYILLYITGNFGDTYPGMEEGINTRSFLWETRNYNGAIATAGRVQDRGGDARDWINEFLGAEEIGYYVSELWAIAIAEEEYTP